MANPPKPPKPPVRFEINARTWNNNTYHLGNDDGDNISITSENSDESTDPTNSVNAAGSASDSSQAIRNLAPAKVSDLGLRKKLNDLATKIISTSTEDQIANLVKNNLTEQEIAALHLDVTAVKRFVSALKGGAGVVSEAHAASVGFVKGANKDQNHIEWVTNPSDNPLKYLHQRLLLANTSALVKAKGSDGISKVKKELQPVSAGEEYGLRKVYEGAGDDSETWLNLGMKARFEEMINRRYQDLALKALPEETFKQKKASLEKLSFNQFAAFIREAIEYDETKLQLEIGEIDAEINFSSSELTKSTNSVDQKQEYKDRIDQLSAQKQTKEMGLARLDGFDKKSDIEISSLVGSKGNGRVDFEGNFDRGFDGMGTYSTLFLKLMEDDKIISAAVSANAIVEMEDANGDAADFATRLKNSVFANRLLGLAASHGNNDILENAIQSNTPLFPGGFDKDSFEAKLLEIKSKLSFGTLDDSDFDDNLEKQVSCVIKAAASYFCKQLKDDKNLFLNLNPRELATLISAGENKIATVMQAANRGRKVRNIAPITDIVDAKNRLVKVLNPNEKPSWWLGEKRAYFENILVRLEEKDEEKRKAVVEKYLAQTPSEAVKEAEGLEEKVKALKAECHKQLKVGEYNFSPLSLEEVTFDTKNTTEVDPTLFSRDDKGNLISLALTAMKGDKTVCYNGGLVLQVYDGNLGFDIHSSQFEALSEFKLPKGSKPLCSIARFDGRDFGEGNGTRNDYCITTVTEINTTKTFITEAVFQSIVEQNAKDYERYAAHLAKEQGLRDVLDIMLVTLADYTQAEKDKAEVAGLKNPKELEEVRLKAEEIKTLAREVSSIKKLLNRVAFAEGDSLDQREAKINKINKFPEDKLNRQIREVNDLKMKAFDTTVDQRELENLNKWLRENSVNGVVFDASDATNPDQLADKIRMVEVSLEQNKKAFFNVLYSTPESCKERIADIERRMLSGKEISAEGKLEAQKFAAHATQDRLSKQAVAQQQKNHFSVKLDSRQIEDLMTKYGSSDGHLWMKNTDKRDFEKLLRSSLPVAPVPGGVSIVKPRLGDSSYIKFADQSKNNSNGGPNFAMVTFAADEKGEFSGDDRAYICIPGTDNIYMEVAVARTEGDLYGTQAKKGDVRIREGVVFHRDSNGKYSEISTDTTLVKDSELTKAFGKSKGDTIRDKVANFSIVASSVIGDQQCAVAVAFNGKVCESRNLTPRLSPYRDVSDIDRNVAMIFPVDANGKYLNKPLPSGKSHSPHLDYKDYAVIAEGTSSEMKEFKSGDENCKKSFKIVMRVCVLEKNGKQSFAKEPLIETFSKEGERFCMRLSEENLEEAELTEEGFDRAALVKEMQDLAKKADVAIITRDPSGKDTTKILKSTDETGLEPKTDERKGFKERIHLKPARPVEIPSPNLAPATSATRVGIPTKQHGIS